MNSQIREWRGRAIRACILAALLWLGEVAFGVWWFVYIIAGLVLYGTICFVWALVLFILDHTPSKK